MTLDHARNRVHDQEFRVTDDVDEENVPDLFLGFGGHSGSDSKLREVQYLFPFCVSRRKGEIIRQLRLE